METRETQLWRQIIDLVRTHGVSEGIDGINEIRGKALTAGADDEVRICDRAINTIRQSL